MSLFISSVANGGRMSHSTELWTSIFLFFLLVGAGHSDIQGPEFRLCENIVHRRSIIGNALDHSFYQYGCDGQLLIDRGQIVLSSQSSLIAEVRRRSERMLAAGQNGEKEAAKCEDVDGCRDRYVARHHRASVFDLFGCQPALDGFNVGARPLVIRIQNQTVIGQFDCHLFISGPMRCDEHVGRFQSPVHNAKWMQMA